MNFLLINPPIYDFAAYDLWTKPLGLLYISSILKNFGARVNLIDCLDRKHPLATQSRSNQYGCGHYYSELVDKPDMLKDVPRKYSRYGLPADTFREIIKKIEKPDIILVTSVMTYWYPGVFEVIKEAKNVFPDTPVILGGIYASICKEHAIKHSAADYVVTGSSLTGLFEILKGLGSPFGHAPEFRDSPPPDHSFYNDLVYATIKTSMGCPFNCSYCASKALHPDPVIRKNPETIISELKQFCSYGITNISFYDDALLFDPENHIIPILKEIIKTGLKLNIHTPNGLHTKFITPELAKLMKSAGFIMPRLSFETSNPAKQQSTGGKVFNEDLQKTVSYLESAGFGHGEFGAYVLMAMPDQDFDEVRDSIRFAHSCGAKVFLTEYSPIPGTKDWEKVNHLLPFDDPLWHNNSIFPLYPVSSWPKFQELKDLAKTLNSQFA